MKKLKFLFYPILLLCSIFLTQSCSNSDDENENPTSPIKLDQKISFTTEASSGTSIEIRVAAYQENKPIRIDWGDGTFVDTKTDKDGKVKGSVKGKNIVCYFDYFVEIDIAYAKITSIDFQNSPNLNQLNLIGNSLTSIDFSKTTLLEHVNLNENKIAKLDLSKLPKLFSLGASNNLLTEIDLSLSPELRNLELSGNKLTVLNISKNPQMFGVSVNFNGLTTIDLSQNPNLVQLNAVNNTKITKIDFTKSPKLKYFDLSGTTVSTLDLSKNPELEQISLSTKSITATKLLEIIKVLPARTTTGKGTYYTSQNEHATTAVKTAFRAKNWDLRLSGQIVN